MTYHNTQADADANTNAIANPANYNPSATQEEIFIRAENQNDLSCITTTSFNIEVFDVEANTAPDIIDLCVQTGNTGEFTAFDLTIKMELFSVPIKIQRTISLIILAKMMRITIMMQSSNTS